MPASRVAARGKRSLEDLFPGLAEDLLDARAAVQLAGRVCWSPAGYRLPAPAPGYAYLTPIRSCLTAYLRVAVLGRPGGSVRSGGSVRTGRDIVGADLVVDATRQPATPPWLAGLGRRRSASPAADRLRVGEGAGTHYLRLPAAEYAVLVAGYPGRPLGLGLLRRAGDLWLLLAGGLPGYRPPADVDGVLMPAAPGHEAAPSGLPAGGFPAQRSGRFSGYSQPCPMSKDPLIDARDVVTELFPHARWTLLAGNVLTPRRTAGSDLDIVVVLPDGDPRVPYRESRYFRGWPVELFVHDAPSLGRWLAKDLSDRKPHTRRMIATGVFLAGEGDQHAARLRVECARELTAGPPRLSGTDRDRARYGLTGRLDDLVHADDAAERRVVAAIAWVEAAQLMLAVAGHWAGSGKWLLRELRDLDPGLADRWLAALGDPDRTAAFVREVLDRAGGPLFAGFRIRGEHPAA